MSYQTSVGTFNPAKRGDSVGGRFYPTKAYIVSNVEGILISTFCWLVDADLTGKQVAQAKGSNTRLAGIAIRSNTESWRVAFGTEDNLLVSQNQTVEVADRGAENVVLQTILGSNPVNPGDSVWASNTNGTIVAGVTNESGYTKTNYIFTTPASVNVASALVKISNADKVEGV